MNAIAQIIPFTKMHGAGNDYIYVNTKKYPLDNPSALAARWSSPHTGIGADGLVLIGPSTIADFSMRIFNADGSEAMMCGNATRCIAKYVYEKGLTAKEEIALETRSGIKILKLHLLNDMVDKVTVDMGTPELIEFNNNEQSTFQLVSDDMEAGGYQLKGTAVSMGNPHLVFFVPAIEELDITTIGAAFEHHPLFPDGVNVEFAEVLSTGNIRMRVWERGSGITMACGTGACATAAAACINQLTKSNTTIHMDGGELEIYWDKQSNHIFMTGGATTVFEGAIRI